MYETYTVKRGDTLYGISNQFGVSVTELANLNNVSADTLKIGQVLKIPTNTGTNPNNMFMYTVKRGDSLYTIARKYNTTVNAIVNLNNLKSTNLSIGQVLRIPEMYFKEEDMVLPNYINYTVKKGDTLYSIAINNNVSVEDLIKDNALTSNNLQIGKTLRIRVPKDGEVTVEECFGEDYTEPSSNDIIYTVGRGDSLYTIARKYNTTVNDIVNINNLKSTSLSIGQKLKIPNQNQYTNNIVYTVKRGDSLYTIAKEFNTTVDNIKKKNNLNTNLLQVGQRLVI